VIPSLLWSLLDHCLLCLPVVVVVVVVVNVGTWQLCKEATFIDNAGEFSPLSISTLDTLKK
jgi:hypothetical protein